MTETSQTVPDRIGHDAWNKVQNMPWTASLELRRRLAWPLVRAQFAWHGIDWGKRWKLFGRPIIQRHRGSRIALGDGLTLRSWPRSNPLAPTAPVVLSTRRSGAVLEIGEDCGFTGTTLVAADRITIGDRVLVGGNASIVDFDFHPLTPEGRAEAINAGAAAPIVIEDDVFVGMDALVMKGGPSAKEPWWVLAASSRRTCRPVLWGWAIRRWSSVNCGPVGRLVRQSSAR